MMLALDDLIALAGMMIMLLAPLYHGIWSNRKAIEALSQRVIRIESEHDLYHKEHNIISVR